MTKKINRKPFCPEKYAESGSEDAAQIALFGWARQSEVRAQYPELVWLFAVPNGAHMSKPQAGKMVAMGMKSGVPDIVLPVRRAEWSGLVMELKKPKKQGKDNGVISPNQKLWLAHFQKQGFGSCVCYGFDEARKMLMAYLDYK